MGFGACDLGFTALAPDQLLIAKQEQRRCANDSNGEKHDVVSDEIRIGHESEAEEHRLPDVHPLAVDERDEANRSEKQSSEEVGTVENWHADFSAIFGPALANVEALAAANALHLALVKLRVDPHRSAVPRFAPTTWNKETKWLRNFSKRKALSF